MIVKLQSSGIAYLLIGRVRSLISQGLLVIADIGPRNGPRADWHEPHLESTVVHKRHDVDDREE